MIRGEFRTLSNMELKAFFFFLLNSYIMSDWVLNTPLMMTVTRYGESILFRVLALQRHKQLLYLTMAVPLR